VGDALASYHQAMAVGSKEEMQITKLGNALKTLNICFA
jgi:hypothetical protein